VIHCVVDTYFALSGFVVIHIPSGSVCLSMPRTVDSPFVADGVEITSQKEVCRLSDVPPADIAVPSRDLSEYEETDDSTYSWMRVEGTYLDGGFVSEQVRKKRNTLPRSVDEIIENQRYVVVTDLRTELDLYITEERFKQLFGHVIFPEGEGK